MMKANDDIETPSIAETREETHDDTVEQFAEKVTDASPPKYNRKRMIIGLVALLAVIGVILGLAIGLTRNNDDDNGSDNQTPTSAFSYSKAFIDNVCSAENPSPTECTKACEPVPCCNPAAENSCLQDELESCVAYAKCQSDVAPAPANLTDICSLENLDDPTECQQACQPVQCCYAEGDKDSCLTTQFLTCLDYAPCQNLRKSQSIAVAPSNFTELCLSDQATDKAQCASSCAAAACCTGENATSCLETDFISCLTYAPCGFLLFPPPNSVVPEPTDSIEAVCTVELILGNGFDQCEQACSSASCCGATDDTNCFLDDPIGCAEYTACVLLLGAGGSVPRPTSNISDVCGLQAIQSGGDSAVQACASACEPAACCVDSQNNCLADGNALACAEYLECAILYVVGQSVAAPPDTLGDVCSSSNIKTDAGRTACEALCETASCCTSLTNNCLINNLNTCADWTLGGCGLILF